MFLFLTISLRFNQIFPCDFCSHRDQVSLLFSTVAREESSQPIVSYFDFKSSQTKVFLIKSTNSWCDKHQEGKTTTKSAQLSWSKLLCWGWTQIGAFQRGPKQDHKQNNNDDDDDLVVGWQWDRSAEKITWECFLNVFVFVLVFLFVISGKWWRWWCWWWDGNGTGQ